MTTSAKCAIAAALLGAAGEVAIMVSNPVEGLPPRAVVVMALFLAGPLLFLALLAWRRRSHPARSRLLLVVTLLVASSGLAVLGILNVIGPASAGNPVLLPLGQWVVVLAVWVYLVVAER